MNERKKIFERPVKLWGRVISSIYLKQKHFLQGLFDRILLKRRNDLSWTDINWNELSFQFIFWINKSKYAIWMKFPFNIEAKIKVVLWGKFDSIFSPFEKIKMKFFFDKNIKSNFMNDNMRSLHWNIVSRIFFAKLKRNINWRSKY
jgi:hypothetical protein